NACLQWLPGADRSLSNIVRLRVTAMVHSSSDLRPFGHVLTCFYRVTILQTRDFSGFGAIAFPAGLSNTLRRNFRAVSGLPLSCRHEVVMTAFSGNSKINSVSENSRCASSSLMRCPCLCHFVFAFYLAHS